MAIRTKYTIGHSVKTMRTITAGASIKMPKYLSLFQKALFVLIGTSPASLILHLRGYPRRCRASYSIFFN